MAENYEDRKLEELQEIARERDLEGRSGLNKKELADALAADDEEKGVDDNAASNVEGGQNEEGGRGVAQTEGSDVASRVNDNEPSEEAQKEYREEYVPQRQKENEKAIKETGEPLPAEGFKSEASDPENPLVEERLGDKEAYQELSDESKDLADLALDAFGPNNLESPYERYVTGAVTEDQAKEQEAERAKLPEGFVGDYGEKVSDEFAKQANLLHGDGKADDEEYDLTDPRRVIDFPPAFSDEELKRGAKADKEAAKAAKDNS